MITRRASASDPTRIPAGRGRSRLGVIGSLALAVMLSCTACAQGAASQLPLGDYSSSPQLNSAAAIVAEELSVSLSDLPGFASLEVVSAGVRLTWAGDAPGQVSATVDEAGLAAKAELADVPGSPSDGRVPIELVESARFGEAELLELTDRIASDQASLESEGIHLSAWGPDAPSNTVRIMLVEYSESAAATLRERYGERVSVSTESGLAVTD